MKLESYEIFEISIPTRRKHTWATSTADVGSGYIILKLITNDRYEGFGEATVMPEWGGDFGKYYGETADIARTVIEKHIFPAIEGMDPFDINLIHHKMDLSIRGYNYAKSAIDQAIYDIIGKAIDKPVYQLLGGKNRRSVPLAHSIGLMEIEEAVSEAVMAVEEGIGHIKVKGGLDIIRDVELIKLLRNTLGPDVKIFLDPNQSYPSVKETIKWVGLMNEKYNLEYVEQPVEGMEQMRQVTQGLNFPVCADESCWTVADTLDVIRYNAADFISIYITKPGGLYPARQIATIAEHAGIRCNVNGSGEFGVGNAANLHLACTGRNINMASVFPITNIKGMEQTKVACRWFEDDIIKKPFVYENGSLVVPDGPGLGIEIDMEKVRKYSLNK